MKHRKEEKIRVPEIRQRRSPRRVLELPIRVFGKDFRGRKFVEDSATLVLSRHGAMICLTHKLIPEQKIEILFQGAKREALFRVVSKAGEPSGKFFFWGVECLTSAENIRDGGIPRPGPKLGPKLGSKDKLHVQVTLRCSKCGMREQADHLDTTEIQAIRELKGLVRDCPACGA